MIKMKSLIENKKGILLPEAIKIMLAVIGIAMLLYLAFSIYSIVTTNSKLKQAKVMSERIDSHINVLLDREDLTETKVLIESPSEWGILAWPYKFTLGNPKTCTGEGCICFCPFDEPILASDQIPDLCTSNGICKNYDFPVKTIYKHYSKDVAEGWFTETSYLDTLRALILSYEENPAEQPLPIYGPFELTIRQTNDGIELIK